MNLQVSASSRVCIEEITTRSRELTVGQLADQLGVPVAEVIFALTHHGSVSHSCLVDDIEAASLLDGYGEAGPVTVEVLSYGVPQ